MVKRKNVFTKNIFRLIKSTRSRFFSLSAIVSIGVAFFVGVSASAPIMSASVDRYNNTYNLKDITIYGNYGFTDEDVHALQALSSVDTVEASYFADVLAGDGEEEKVVRVHSYDENQQVNRFELVKGRMPENDNEVVAEKGGDLKTGFDLGDTVELSLPDGSHPDTLKTHTVKIVGLINTPLYLNMSKETSTLNNLAISTYFYIPSSAFSSSYYHEINILAKDAKKYHSFSDQYETYIEQVEDEIQTLAQIQQKKTALSIKEEASASYQDGLTKYQDGLAEYQTSLDTYNQQISENSQKLEDSKRELEAGLQQLEEAKIRLANAQSDLNTQKNTNQQAINLQQATLNQTKATLIANQNALNTQKATLQQNQTDLNNALAQLPAAITLYQAEQQLRTQIASFGISGTTQISMLAPFSTDLAQLANTIFPSGYTGKTIQDLQDGLDTRLDNIAAAFSLQSTSKSDRLLELQNLQTTYTTDLANVNTALSTTIPNAEAQIQNGFTQVTNGQLQLNQAQQQLDQQIADGQRQIDDGYAQLASNQATLDNASQQIAQGESDLQAAIETGRAQLQDAAQTLQESKAKLDEAKRNIDNLQEGEWTILDRDSHYASVTFKNTIHQMEAIARIFPAFFILVAALVCLTTMTRLVEEERSEIGTMRALGYTKLQCAIKYIIYAVLATSIGIVVGGVFGLATFPLIIYHAWRLMFILPSVYFVVPWGIILFTTVLFILAMSLATWYACKADTQDVPSQLMRPKAPIAGKKTIFERIPFLWNHLNFTNKVTLRNLFRYKKRFFMTILGVAGCTALMLIGFGIRDSIANMVDINFKDIIHYDGLVSFDQDANTQQKKEALQQIQSYPDVEFANMGFVYTTKTYDDKVDETATVHVFDEDEIQNVFDLRTRKHHQKITLGDDGVVINEKLAENLNVGVGDQITVEDFDGVQAKVNVSAITEMYINHYVFMSDTFYENTFHKDVNPNVVYLSSGDNLQQEESLATKIANIDGVVGVSLFDSLLENFNAMVSGLNGIIWVLIFSSMLLAVVVLSNLITVNISERQREIATLKVLGFRQPEVKRYIFKENNILSMIGGIVGMPLGILLHRYIMSTVEMDYLMFGRDISMISFAYAFVLTMLFSILVNRLMTKRLQRIRMVESLKSVE